MQVIIIVETLDKIRSIALDGLAQDISSFRNTEADLAIVCEGKTFPVHSAVLCTRSTVFAAMLKHDTKEAQDRKIEINDTHQAIVELFLR